MPVSIMHNSHIDTATAEIAGHVRDGRVGSHARYRDQDHYDEAMRLRDEIITGTLQLAGALPEWVAAVNGSGKRPWFIMRKESAPTFRLLPFSARYHNDPGGQLVRYASFETASARADKLNKAETQS